MNAKKKKQNDKDDAGTPAPDQPLDNETTAPGEEGAGTPPPPAPAPEEEALEMRLLRLQADFDNYRKRTLREKSEWQWKANEDLVTELLPVLDHFELGLKTAVKQNAEPAVIDGFQMIYDQFIAALRKVQVHPVEAEGQTFDPNLHEAITFVPSQEHPEQAIIAETRRGYRLGDKLLRPAQVVVSSGPAAVAAEQEEASPA